VTAVMVWMENAGMGLAFRRIFHCFYLSRCIIVLRLVRAGKGEGRGTIDEVALWWRWSSLQGRE